MNPYYKMLELMAGEGPRAAIATLRGEVPELWIDGRPAAIAGKAKGLDLKPGRAGEQYLCVGDEGGWFVICPLEDAGEEGASGAVFL